MFERGKYQLDQCHSKYWIINLYVGKTSTVWRRQLAMYKSSGGLVETFVIYVHVFYGPRPLVKL